MTIAATNLVRFLSATAAIIAMAAGLTSHRWRVVDLVAVPLSAEPLPAC